MRTKRFTFLCAQDERDAISLLSAYHHRSQGDTIRLLIIQAVEKLSDSSNSIVPQQSGEIPQLKSFFHKED